MLMFSRITTLGTALSQPSSQRLPTSLPTILLLTTTLSFAICPRRRKSKFIFFCILLFLISINTRNIKAATSFVNLGVYANPVRAAPSLFSVEQNRMVYAKTSKNAVLLLTGMVGSCNIVEPCKATTHPASGLVKRIILFTFEGHYDRLVNFLGTVFKTSAMVGPCHSSGCLSISTKKEGINLNSEYLIFYWITV